jgi:small nuclear ribonucleoprotein E
VLNDFNKSFSTILSNKISKDYKYFLNLLIFFKINFQFSKMNPQKKIQRMITRPINYLFDLYQTKTRIQIWIFDNKDILFEGKILGFDEYMNMVLDECEEVNDKKKTRNYLGRLMLKGDNITLVRAIS